MLDWCLDQNGRFKIERVALSDLDCALKPKGDKLFNHKIGNVMWRSPEGQVGRELGNHRRCFPLDSW